MKIILSLLLVFLCLKTMNTVLYEHCTVMIKESDMSQDLVQFTSTYDSLILREKKKNFKLKLKEFWH